MVRPGRPTRRYKYTVHRPGDYSPKKGQGRIIFIVRHQQGHPTVEGPLTSKLRRTGETVRHHQLHYGSGAKAIVISESPHDSRVVKITHKKVFEKGKGHTGGLGLFMHGDRGHTTFDSLPEALDEAVRHATFFRALSDASVRELRATLERVARDEWGGE